MTAHGEKLSAITVEAVTDRLQDVADGKAVKRLVAAREYLAGHSPARIAEKYGWPEQTIYSWLDRLEERGLDEGLEDESPPGRPSALSAKDWERFEQAVNGSPADVGYDESEWSTRLAQTYLRERFDLAFTRRHVRRLLHDAGVSL